MPNCCIVSCGTMKNNNQPQLSFHRYHEWMKSEELQQLTASDELTLQQEYQMQISWREDEDKCTFIILDQSIYCKNTDEIESMVGDTNIFITDKDCLVGEIEIMIAEKSARGKGYGWEAVILMLLYGINFINLNMYIAKIALTNNVSIKMFEKLGFIETSRSDIFKEITLEKNVDNEWKNWLQKQIQKFEINTF